MFGRSAQPWRDLRYDTHRLDPSAAASLTSSRGLNVPEFWFVHLYYWGIRAGFIVAAMLLLVAAMGVAARSLRAALYSDSAVLSIEPPAPLE